MLRRYVCLVAIGLATGASVRGSFAQGADAQVERAPTEAQRGILVLASADATRPHLRQITDAFRDVTFTADVPAALYLESIDQPRFDRPGYTSDLRAWLKTKYAGKRLDLVVALGDEAVDFLVPRQGEPWQDVPVLFMDVTSARVDTARGLPQASGLLLDDTFPASLETVKAILPGTKRIVLAFGASPLERRRHLGFADKVRDANLGLEPIELAGGSVRETATRVAHLSADSVLFILAPIVDTKGRASSPTEACTVIAAVANVPSFTLDAQDLGCGGVGGPLRDWAAVGRLLGQRALTILDGAPPETARVPITEFTALAFDARQLARWRIPEARLPDGSRVRFRPASVWRDHAGLILGGVAFALVQSALIGGLLVERRRRRRAELESRRQVAVMAHLDRHAAMGELATSIAHELNQPLNAILQNTGVAQMLLKDGATPETVDELREILEDIRQDDIRASEVIRQMRGMLQKHDLGQQSVDVNAVVRDTLPLVRAEAAAREVVLETDLTDRLAPVLGERVHLQQVLLNLLLNGMDAVAGLPPERRRVSVRTCRTAEFVEVWVHDHGTGIDPAHLTRIFDPLFSTKNDGMGMGLAIARSIIEAHGGRMQAVNNPDCGATLAFSIPVNPGVTA